MKKFYLITGTIIVVLFLSGMFYLINRNSSVYSFRDKVIDTCYDYNVSDIKNKKIEDAFLVYHNLPSYNDMVLSFKPLKLESYLDKPIVNELNRPYIENLNNFK